MSYLYLYYNFRIPNMILSPFLIKYQEDLVCRILSFSSQPHILSTKLAASWPQVEIFCIFEEIIFPQSWRTSFQLEYQTVKFYCTFVYTSICFFQSQIYDHRNNNLKLKSLLNLAKLAMFGFHLKYYTFQL